MKGAGIFLMISCFVCFGIAYKAMNILFGVTLREPELDPDLKPASRLHQTLFAVIWFGLTTVVFNIYYYFFI
tara:strand:- start:185 stop:400 length:216 start_codon:yes stop_codon:yes gene_type:complete